MRTTRRTMIVAAAGTVMLLAAGCSSGSDTDTGATKSAAPGTAATSPAAPTPSPFAGDSARTILAKAQDAADGAKSVHVKGVFSEEGEKVAINMKLSYGKGAYGYLKIGKDVIAIRRVGRTVYMKAPSAFWKKNAPGSEKVFGGQWIRGNYKGAVFTGFGDFTSKSLVTEALKPGGKLTRVAGKPVGGVATVGLKDSDKKDPGILYIQAAGPAYPVLAVPTGKGASGSITFSEWDQPVTIAAPGGSIDIDKLSA